MKYLKIFLGMLLVFFFLACSAEESTTQDDSTTQNDSTTQDGTIKDASVEKAPANWYLRLVAEDTSRDLKTESTQLGMLQVENVSDRALKAVGTTDENYIDIVFENPAQLDDGRYKALFYANDPSQEKSWTFTVTTDDANANVTLTWHGLFVLTPKTDDPERFSEYRSVTNPLLKQMKLVDLVTSKEMQIIRDGDILHYIFNMNGVNQRNFKWVVATEEIAIALPPVVEKDQQTNKAISRSSSRSSAAAITSEPKPRSFDFSQPTMPVFNK